MMRVIIDFPKRPREKFSCPDSAYQVIASRLNDVAPWCDKCRKQDVKGVVLAEHIVAELWEHGLKIVPV
jgi:hypothetical protein